VSAAVWCPYGTGDKAWRDIEAAVVARVAQDLPAHLPLVYAYSDEALDLQHTLEVKMQAGGGARTHTHTHTHTHIHNTLLELQPTLEVKMQAGGAGAPTRDTCAPLHIFISRLKTTPSLYTTWGHWASDSITPLTF